MKASVIIASHNERDLLSKTIASCVEACSDLDYEMIVADDGSTDGSVKLCRVALRASTFAGMVSGEALAHQGGRRGKCSRRRPSAGMNRAMGSSLARKHDD